MRTRREFLKISGLAGTALMVPRLFIESANAVNFKGKRLVVIQLSGGNDWLNTVIPIKNGAYYKSRPKLAISIKEALRIDRELALHPQLKGIQSIFDQGEMAIFQGVGYPEPNRSHFRSMDIWHTATDGRTFSEDGWLGKWSESRKENFPALEIGSSISLAMKTEGSKAISLENIGGLKKVANDRVLRAIASAPHDHQREIVSYLYQTAGRICDGADYLSEKLDVRYSQASYPKNPLSRDLKTIADLLKAGAETRVFYASLSGFDTHASQMNQHQRLLGYLDQALRAFREDMKKHNFWNDTLVMVFSEFGRRVKENAGLGTDHGTAGNVWIFGGKLTTPGIRGETPSLHHLDDGDLKYNLDFRRIYAGILAQHLEADHEVVLNGKFDPIKI